MKRSRSWLLVLFVILGLCLVSTLVVVVFLAPSWLPFDLPIGSRDRPIPGEPQATTPEPGGGAIEMGETVEGDLQATIDDEWAFTAEAGDVVTIWMSSDAFDSYLQLYDPFGESIAYDNNSASVFNSDAVMRNVRLPADGTYTIRAHSIERSSGPYTLGLRAISPGASGGSISAGETVEGYLEFGDQDEWTFKAEAGDEVVISLSREALDAILELLAPDGGVLAGDYTESPEMQIPLNVDATGTYTIRIRSNSGRSSGPYRLTLEEVIP